MSTGTQALQRSITNQQAQSQLSISTGTRVLRDQCQTKEHDLSYQCQREPKLLSINTQPRGTITTLMFQREPNYSYHLIKDECIAANFHLDIYVTD